MAVIMFIGTSHYVVEDTVADCVNAAITEQLIGCEEDINTGDYDIEFRNIADTALKVRVKISEYIIE